MRERTGKVKARKRRRRQGEVRLSDRLEYALLRSVVLLLRALPVDIGPALMGTGWQLIGPWTARHKRALGNLALAFPDIDDAARRKIAAAQWNNLGRTFAESFMIDRIVDDPQRIELAISVALEDRLRQGGGFIVAGIHSANWEIAAFPIRGYRSVAGLYQNILNPLVNDLVISLRSRIFDGGLFTKGAETPGRMMQWLRDGNAIGILADSREGRGVAVTAFGKPVLANPFPAMTARRLGTPLLAGRAVRLKGCRFRVEGVEIPVPVTDDPQADVRAATQALHDQFDAWIRDRPGEWMWILDRWRQSRQPPRRPRAER